MENLNLTKREIVFIDRVLAPFGNIIKTNPDLAVDLLEKMLQQTLKGVVATDKAKELIDGILYKIAMNKITAQLDDVLSMDEDEQDRIVAAVGSENTKAASYSRTYNITDKHKKIMDILSNHPGSSRRELADILCWSINRITPRVNELVEMGKVRITGTKYDYKTDRSVQTLEVA